MRLLTFLSLGSAVIRMPMAAMADWVGRRRVVAIYPLNGSSRRRRSSSRSRSRSRSRSSSSSISNTAVQL